MDVLRFYIIVFLILKCLDVLFSSMSYQLWKPFSFQNVTSFEGFLVLFVYYGKFFQRSTHYCKLHVESFLLWNHSSYRYSDVRAILLGNFQQIKLFSGIRFLLCQWYCHRHPVTSEEIRQSALHWSRRTPRWVRREWNSSDGAKKLKYFWTRSNIERFLWRT